MKKNDMKKMRTKDYLSATVSLNINNVKFAVGS